MALERMKESLVCKYRVDKLMHLTISLINAELFFYGTVLSHLLDTICLFLLHKKGELNFTNQP